jgi:hypothetical protein
VIERLEPTVKAPRRSDRLRPGILLALCGLSAEVQADDQKPGWHYGVDVGIGETDNVTLVEADKVAQTIAVADADFSLFEQTRRLAASVKGNFSYDDYLQGAYKPELFGRFDGTATVALVPERLTWFVAEDWGQEQINPFLNLTPANLQNINTLATGPELNFLLGSLNHVTLDARYTRVTYEDSPFDSNRFSGAIQFGVPFSAHSEFSFNTNFERVLFADKLVNTDYSRSSAYLSYELHGARTDLTGKLGVSRSDADGEGTNGSLARLEFKHRISPRARITLLAGRELTDGASSFSSLQTGAINQIAVAQSSQTSSVYTLTYSTLSWAYERGGLQFAVSGHWEEDVYGNALEAQQFTTTPAAAPVVANASLLNYDRYGGEFSVAQKLTRTFSAEFLGSLYETAYAHGDFAADQGGSSYEDARIGCGLRWQRPLGFTMHLHYDHALHDVSHAVLGTGYSQNSINLTIGYKPQ